MTKENGHRWNFVEKRKNSMGHSREDSSFASFVDNKYRCLVREYIQNSMDAIPIERKGETVSMKISFGQLKCSEYPELIISLKDHIYACSEHCKQYPNSKNPYESKLEYLTECCEKDRIGYLKVSDYNTDGMFYVDDEDKTSPFQACVRETSASFKGNEQAGGSHGLGKTVGFVNSGLNAVYYSTCTPDGHKYGEGVIKLCDHKISLGVISNSFEAVAFYDRNGGNCPDSGDNIPEDFRREESGTDAFVLGMEYSEETIKIMRMEVIRSFFKAINDNLLAIDICGEEFNKGNLQEKLDIYFPEEEYSNFDKVRKRNPELHFNPRPYYMEVINEEKKDDNHIVLDSVVDFPGQFDELGHAVLMVWKSERIKFENTQDSVVYMRDNSMVIEVKRGRNAKGYYALFYCDGEGSKYLRKLENVTHDKWDESELRDQPKAEVQKAKKVKTAIRDFINACEDKLFPSDLTAEHRLMSLKRHKLGALGDTDNQEDEDDDWPSTNIIGDGKTNKKSGSGDNSSMSVRTKKKKKKKGTGQEGLGEEQGPGGAGGEGEEPTGGSGGNGGQGSSGGSNLGPGGQEGNSGSGSEETSPDDGDETETGENNSKGKQTKEIKLSAGSKHLMPCHDGEYALKLALKVPKDYEGCSVVLQVQGVNGKMPLEIKRVPDGYKIGGQSDNIISGFDLSKDGVNIIRFTPKEYVKNYTLIITAYGH